MIPLRCTTIRSLNSFFFYLLFTTFLSSPSLIVLFVALFATFLSSPRLSLHASSASLLSSPLASPLFACSLLSLRVISFPSHDNRPSSLCTMLNCLHSSLSLSLTHTHTHTRSRNCQPPLAHAFTRSLSTPTHPPAPRCLCLSITGHDR
jgi:hypothetical protein